MVTYNIMTYKFMYLCDVMYSVDNYTDAFILKTNSENYFLLVNKG